ncbi:hypothetical protein ISS86_02735 [Candidatus Microgenomates bacterium]|nr:hypothetical protein [Candidatus Microgenomates bacterium]
MTLDEILDFITNITPLSVLKTFLILSLLFYVVFTWVVLRQEKFMSRVVEVPISPFLTILAHFHFWASLALFIAALFVL